MQKYISRRDLLKLGIYGVAGINLGLVSGCATPIFEAYKEPTPVKYPKLPGEKIQSPEHYGLEGCYIGGYGLPLKFYYDLAKKPPSILFVPYIHDLKGIHSVYRAFMGINENEKLEATSVPLVTYDLSFLISFGGLEGIINGEEDSSIIRDAQMARKIGEKQGGFFIRTLREMNIRNMWPPWRGNPKRFKQTYKHIWNIFENEGANEYATWMISPYSSSVRFTGPWESYYPGDKYVDWVGFNGYNYGGQGTHPHKSFYSLFVSDYNHMRKNHPNKPIMIVATGTDNGKSKPQWITKAFSNVKNDFPGIKAMCWWHDYWSHNDIYNFDSRINSSDATLKAFIDGVSDPYFLGGVPYLKNF